MTPKQWEKVEVLLSRAVTLAGHERLNYVREQCAGDDHLEREVLSLIEAHGQADKILPGLNAVRSLLGALESEYYLGRQIGPYKVEALLGRGGMALVFQASGQQRKVALKVFHPGAQSKDEQRRRIDAECRALAALDHPNIVQMHGLEREGDTDYLVMELVEGETLADILRRGPLPPLEAMRITAQVVDGLAAAHALGITHRDIKPANIMIDTTGQVRILDFGLCVWTPSQTPAEPHTVSLSESRALRGTIGYLAPEQIEGKRPDRRSDIFSLGVVIYEMLTAERPFQRANPEATMGAILHADPAPPAAVSASLWALIGRCLKKDPNQRFRDAGELRQAIAAAETSPSRWSWPDVPWRRLAYVAVVLAVVGTAASVWPGSSRTSPPRFQKLTDDGEYSVYPAIAPDGQTIAYASNRGGGPGLDLWIQQPGAAPRRLTNHPADDLAPSFSPDGRWILFTSTRDSGGIYRMPADGGKEERLAPFGFNPSYSPDGRRVAYWRGSRARDLGRGVHITDIAQGTTLAFHPEFVSAAASVWSPDGKYLLFNGRMEERGDNRWWVATTDGHGAARPVPDLPAELSAGHLLKPRGMVPSCWLDSGQVLFQYFAGLTLTSFAIPFSFPSARFTGPPRQIAAGGDAQTHPACGPRGLIAFASSRFEVGIWKKELVSEAGLAHLASQPSGDTLYPSVTSDGKRLTYVGGTSTQDIARSMDLSSATAVNLAGPYPRGIWLRQSRDGSVVGLSRDVNRSLPLEIHDPLGKLLRSVPHVQNPWDISPGGRYVLSQGKESNEIRLHWASGGEEAARTILAHPRMDLRDARFSPDLKWIAFTGQEGSGSVGSFITPFRAEHPVDPADWVKASETTSSHAEWAPDGNTLYFLSQEDGWICIWAQRLDKRTKRPLGAAYAVEHFHHESLTLLNIPKHRTTMAVAKDKILFSARQSTSVIWMVR